MHWVVSSHGVHVLGTSDQLLHILLVGPSRSPFFSVGILVGKGIGVGVCIIASTSILETFGSESIGIFLHQLCYHSFILIFNVIETF